MTRWKWLLMVLIGTILAISCTIQQERTHNDLGGYIPACGELPGLIGDDC